MRNVVAVAVAVAVLLAAAKAEAQKPPWIAAEPPAAWTELPGLSRSIATTMAQSGAFGDQPGDAGALAVAQPGTGAFYLSWLVAPRTEDAAAAVRRAFDQLRASRSESSPMASSTEEVRWSESVKDSAAEAVFEWRHLSNETASLVRAIAWVAVDGTPRMVKAECVLSTIDGKTSPDVEKICRDALATVKVTAAAGERAPLAALPASAAPEPQALADVPDGEQPTVSTAPAGPPGKVLYTGPPPAQEEKGSKWFLVLGGLLLVGGLFLSMRARQRSAAKSEESAKPEPEPEPEPEDKK
jgi:hypothetical protein